MQWTHKNSYILCVLQMEWDANIKEFSPYRTMGDFIHHCNKKFANQNILFKVHPRDKKNLGRYKAIAKGDVIYGIESADLSEKHFELIRISADAELVYGINSTSLFVSLMLGVPTIAIGDGILKSNAGLHAPDKILAACYNSQILWHNAKDAEDVFSRIHPEIFS